tara:strand:- start:160 stop:354 length:195 start_codon:yes stop_codon:yes gene_type:complete
VFGKRYFISLIEYFKFAVRIYIFVITGDPSIDGRSEKFIFDPDIVSKIHNTNSIEISIEIGDVV